MKVFLVQHSHSDPGYTHPRDEVWRHQLRNIARSVEFARRDPEHRFTVECFWVIDEAQRRGYPLPEGFLEAARAGRISLTATYLNGSDHLDAEDFRRMLRYARRFCDERRIPLRSAMQCDVNGVNACMPDLLNEVGVTRMAFAINDERGGAPFRRPNAFYWRGPGGGRILVFNGFVYLRANEYGMHRGFEAFRAGARRLAEDLARTGYDLPVCLLQGCGTYDDNGLAATWMAEMARRWRESGAQRHDGDAFDATDPDASIRAPAEALYRGLEFVSATIDEFFDALESCGATFPEYAGTWPDWWSDGLASAPLELKRAYEARRTLRAIEPFLDPKDMAVGTPFEAAQRDLWMYLEHTFGSWRSVGEPAAPDSKRQWADKSVLVHRAAEEAALLAEEVLAALAEGKGGVLFPPACRFADRVACPVPREDFTESGALNAQAQPRIALRLAVETPATPYAMATLHAEARPLPGQFAPFEVESFIRTEPSSGHTPPEIPDEGRAWMPTLVREDLLGTRLGLRHGEAGVQVRRREAVVDGIKTIPGPFGSSLRTRLTLPGWSDLSILMGMAADGVARDFVLCGVQQPEMAPHAFFLLFRPPEAPVEVWAESGGFWHRPGLDELPGACRDWHVVHRGVKFRFRDGTNTAFWTPDAPVVHFGGVNTSRWGSNVHPQNGALAVCLYHNYWYVNFPATASGPMTFRFRVTSGRGLDAERRLESWNTPFLVFLDTPRGRALRERRIPRRGGEVIR